MQCSTTVVIRFSLVESRLALAIHRNMLRRYEGAAPSHQDVARPALRAILSASGSTSSSRPIMVRKSHFNISRIVFNQAKRAAFVLNSNTKPRR